jgi:hypothetical protein
LPVVLYECETWSLTLREERRLRAFESRPKRDEVKEEWRKLYNEELNNLYSSPNIVQVIKSFVRPRTQHDCHHDTKVKPEAATAVIELLMMGGKTPETC